MQSDPVEATSSPTRAVGRLLFSMGCHAGLSVSDVSLGLSGSIDAALEPDWAQQLAGVGDLLVGNTGYGYGDTDIVAASEKLMTYFAQRLDGSLTIGDALHLAKQRYSADVPLVTPYDEKVLQEVVMYGLPMYRVDTTPTPPPARPAGVTPAGAPGGLTDRAVLGRPARRCRRQPRDRRPRADPDRRGARSGASPNRPPTCWRTPAVSSRPSTGRSSRSTPSR